VTSATVHPHEGKLDVWICWWVLPVFYTLFGVIFVLLTRVMPPPSPGKSTAEIVAYFEAHSLTIKIGFALLMLVIGLAGVTNGLVAYQMKRMSVNPWFADAYIGTLAVGAIPGCLFAGFSFLTAVFRPDRDPELIALRYDVALLTFVGSLGCFATNYLIFAIAIFLDRNHIFPTWLDYVLVWQVVTEVVALPVFIFRDGAFAWNGAIAFWEGTLVFGVFLSCLIVLLRKAIERQPPGQPVQD
jgi:hypothetical protein